MILYMELHTGSSGEWLNMSNVKVAVRVRPLNQRWVNISLSLKQKVLQLVKLQESHLFTFKKVEPEKCYFEFWDYWFIFLQWKGWKWQIHRGGSWRQSQHPQCKGRSGSHMWRKYSDYVCHNTVFWNYCESRNCVWSVTWEQILCVFWIVTAMDFQP